jgi:hypothetical protein
MNDDNTRAAWVCAIWCGVAARLIKERLRREPPMTEAQSAKVRSMIQESLRGHPYLEMPAREALAELDRE